MAGEQEIVGGIALRTILINTKEVIDNAALYPVNIDSLTPESIFRKNAVIGINGVLYRAKRDTEDFPVPLAIADGQFVVDIVDGKRAFVVTDNAMSDDWEIWTDAALDYWIQSLANQLHDISDTCATVNGKVDSMSNKVASALQPNTTITQDGHTYTVSQLLQSMAKLMESTIVVNE